MAERGQEEEEDRTPLTEDERHGVEVFNDATRQIKECLVRLDSLKESRLKALRAIRGEEDPPRRSHKTIGRYVGLSPARIGQLLDPQRTAKKRAAKKKAKAKEREGEE